MQRKNKSPTVDELERVRYRRRAHTHTHTHHLYASTAISAMINKIIIIVYTSILYFYYCHWYNHRRPPPRRHHINMTWRAESTKFRDGHDSGVGREEHQ